MQKAPCVSLPYLRYKMGKGGQLHFRTLRSSRTCAAGEHVTTHIHMFLHAVLSMGASHASAMHGLRCCGEMPTLRTTCVFCVRCASATEVDSRCSSPFFTTSENPATSPPTARYDGAHIAVNSWQNAVALHQRLAQTLYIFVGNSVPQPQPATTVTTAPLIASTRHYGSVNI